MIRFTSVLKAVLVLSSLSAAMADTSNEERSQQTSHDLKILGVNESPDGVTRIELVSSRDSANNEPFFRVVTKSGLINRRLEIPFREAAISWSPDGRFVAVSAKPTPHRFILKVFQLSSNACHQLKTRFPVTAEPLLHRASSRRTLDLRESGVLSLRWLNRRDLALSIKVVFVAPESILLQRHAFPTTGYSAIKCSTVLRCSASTGRGRFLPHQLITCGASSDDS